MGDHVGDHECDPSVRNLMKAPFFDRLATSWRLRSLTGDLGRLLGPTGLKTLVSVADRLIVAGTNFLTLVIVVRAAGVEALGVFTLAWTVLLAVNALQEAMIHSPFTVFVGRRRDAQERRRYAGAAAMLQTGVALMVMVLVLATALAMMVAGAGSLINHAAWGLLIAIPGASLREFARRFMFAKLAAAGVLMLDACVAALQLGGLATLWFAGLLSPGTVLLVMAVAAGLPALAWAARSREAFSRPKWRMIAVEAKRHLLFGRWLGGGQMADLAVTHGVAWLLAALAGTAATGIFAACNSIVLVINPLLLGIGSILLPRAALAHHQHGEGEVGRIVWKVTGLLTLTVGMVSLAVILGGKYVVAALYALESPEQVGPTIILLALANFVGATSFAIDNGLIVLQRQNVNLIASLIGLVTTVLVALLLTPSLGVVGTATGVLVGTLLNSLFQIVIFIRLVGPPSMPLVSQSRRRRSSGSGIAKGAFDRS